MIYHITHELEQMFGFLGKETVIDMGDIRYRKADLLHSACLYIDSSVNTDAIIISEDLKNDLITVTYYGRTIPAIGWNNPPSWYKMTDTFDRKEAYNYFTDVMRPMLRLFKTNIHDYGTMLEFLSNNSNHKDTKMKFGSHTLVRKCYERIRVKYPVCEIDDIIASQEEMQKRREGVIR